MPFALQPEQVTYRAEIADRMRVARLKLAAANAEAVAFAADVATAAQAEIDAQPTRWRTTRAGRAAQAWADAWRDYHATPTDPEAVDRFNALPTGAAPE
jgi:hypothetical protein